MSKKSLLKLLDGASTAFLTVNRILTSGYYCGGVSNTSLYVDHLKVPKGAPKIENNKNTATDSQHGGIKSENFKNIKINPDLPLKDIFLKDISNDQINKPIEKTEKSNILNKESFQKEFKKNDNLEEPEIKSNQNSKIKLNEKIVNLPVENESKKLEKEENSNESFLIKTDKTKFIGKPSKIPTSSFSRALNFGFLGASLLTNSFTQMMKDKVSLKEEKSFSSYLVNETNAEKVSRTLCKMRGAALKLGQILSTFEDVVIPEPIRSALERARAEADVMPSSQMFKILKNEYGKEWKTKFSEFHESPFAAASIGQVHEAYLNDGTRVAVKIQYPGVAQSIDSDLQNLKRVFEYFKIFPKGLYIDDLIKNLGNELRMECDYIQEAEKQMLFKNLLISDRFYYVPKIYKEYSSNLILCSEFVEGVNVDELEALPQSVKDFVGEKILELTLRELFEFKFMQTDPNPANFFYDHKNSRLNLIDFGAARSYEEDFVKNYMGIVHSAAINNHEKIIKMSQEIGFLTGMESQIMLESHTNATLAVGEPFNIQNKEEYFDFGNQKLTKKIYKLIPTMLKHRLKAPPTEIYSLHRKLSGAYLICIKLKSRVRAKKLFFDIYDKFYKDDK
jgi:aarF domain-containing kinase